MSARSFLQAHVYDCPAGQLPAALAVLERHNLRHENENEGAPGQLSLHTRYVDEDMTDTAAETIARELAEAAPGASFVLWTDPPGPALGELRACTPALGMYSAECNGSGEPLLTPAAIMEVVDKHIPSTIRYALERACGEPWFSHWDEMAAEQKSGAETGSVGTAAGRRDDDRGPEGASG